jgi:hypothetical protein
MENLEHRLLLSQNGAGTAGFAEPTFVPGSGPYAMPTPAAGPQQINILLGATPQQLESAYGVNQISFGKITGNGAGQTVAIVDAYDNPGFLDSSDPNFANSTLAQYDQIFGLPDPPSFTKFNQNGSTDPNKLPPPSPQNWAIEIAIDIEAVHLMAPAASIDLVEATANSNANLFTAEKTAASLPGVSVVSNSFGGGESPSETKYDTIMLAPHVTFLAASGDNGAIATTPGGGASGGGPIYPSTSPNVVAVGGTSLYLNSAEAWSTETGWSYGSDAYAGQIASGGGISAVELKPAYQQGVQQSNKYRTTPDIAADADPTTGIALFDPYDFGAETPFAVYGGTSLATPLWAGMVAIANQGRALNGAPPLTGYSQTLPALYNLPATDYHQITVGYNGFNAGPGYNLVTGLGSPKANLLIPQLAAYGLAKQAAVTTEPPASVVAGGSFGLVVSAQDANGNTDLAYNGTATLSLKNPPAGVQFTPMSVPVVNGQAVFSGLVLSKAGTGYVFQVTIPGLASKTVTTSAVAVTAPTPGVGVFYPLPFESSLQAAINAAETDHLASNVIALAVSTAPYAVTGGPILIQPSGSAQTLTIVGQGQSSTIISAEQSGRLFEIGGPGSSPSIVFQNLTIEGGVATDSGGLGLPGAPAVGGAMVIDGGSVSLTNVAVLNNEAGGAHGVNGVPGTTGSGNPGGNGGAGGDARGGAIYLGAGSLTLTGSTISGNFAQGGAGGQGGQGGNGYSLFYPSHASSSTSMSTESVGAHSHSGGNGGAAGAAGSGYGGGVYVGGGTLTIVNDTFSGDLADGGMGATGGFGGSVLMVDKPAGNGGAGAAGGNGAGGAVYVAGGTVALRGSTLTGDDAVGFSGGAGGFGGHGGTGSAGAAGPGLVGGNGLKGQPGGNGATGGAGGSGTGGGLYLAAGAVSLSHDTLSDDLALGGFGGLGGKGGNGGSGGAGGNGGPAGAAGIAGAGGNGGPGGAGGQPAVGGNGGAAYGGGADIASGTITLDFVNIVSNAAAGGPGGIGGPGGNGGAGGAGGQGGNGRFGGNGGAGGPGGAGSGGNTGGAGGAAYGGGVYLGGGLLSMVAGSIASNLVLGGPGAPGGPGGAGGAGGNGGNGGVVGAGGHGGNGGPGASGGASGPGGAATFAGIDVAPHAKAALNGVASPGNAFLPGGTSGFGPPGPAGPGGNGGMANGGKGTQAPGGSAGAPAAVGTLVVIGPSSAPAASAGFLVFDQALASLAGTGGFVDAGDARGALRFLTRRSRSGTAP